MSKLTAILNSIPDVFGTCYVSTNKYYLEFLDQFYSKKLDFGNMHDDRLNYTKDINRVYKDYKKATIAARKKN